MAQAVERPFGRRIRSMWESRAERELAKASRPRDPIPTFMNRKTTSETGLDKWQKTSLEKPFQGVPLLDVKSVYGSGLSDRASRVSAPKRHEGAATALIEDGADAFPPISPTTVLCAFDARRRPRTWEGLKARSPFQGTTLGFPPPKPISQTAFAAEEPAFAFSVERNKRRDERST